MADKVYKVKYVGGQGVRLTHPLTDGRVELPGHEIIELTDYGDFVRLTDNPSWIDCTEEEKAVKAEEAPKDTETEPNAKESGKTDDKSGDKK